MHLHHYFLRFEKIEIVGCLGCRPAEGSAPGPAPPKRSARWARGCKREGRQLKRSAPFQHKRASRGFIGVYYAMWEVCYTVLALGLYVLN